MNNDKYRQWNEFDWEIELRDKDKQIKSYTQKLSAIVDLPNEEDISLEHYSHSSGLSWLETDFESDEDSDEELFFEAIEQKNNSSLYLKMGSLASKFSTIIASSTNYKYIAHGIQILSLYGNILSKILDIVELERNEMPALKTALSKRIISNINILIGRLKEIKHEDLSNAGTIKNQIINLLKYREKILDIRYKYESTK